MNKKTPTVTTVKASEVEVNRTLLETYSGAKMLQRDPRLSIEASSIKKKQKYHHIPEKTFKINHFLMMLQIAFNGHKPICITPDHLWLMICQGFAEHIKQNADHFKERITGLSEKETISVRRDDFVKGGKNPWEEIFPEFSKKMNEILKEDIYSHIVLNFSTTTIKESTAFEISFMESMSSYFDYELVTWCGIPEIHIKGTVEDYTKMLDALEVIKTFELGWWVDKVVPLIEKIISSIEGEKNEEFWKSIFKEESESGGPTISGWITHFFPYIENSDSTTRIKNPSLYQNSDSHLKLDNFPRGLSKVPFKWNYFGTIFPMEFISGFIGITEDKGTHIMETEINWMILETNPHKYIYPIKKHIQKFLNNFKR